MITHQFAALETPMEKIARIMARRYDVNVRIEGELAYVNLETMDITLPHNIEGMALLNKHIHGLLDHETAHVIYTDVEIPKKIKDESAGDKRAMMIRKHVWNACEDVWIEKAHGGNFIGVKSNLDAVNKALYEKADTDWDEGKLDAFGKLLYAFERCWNGHRTVGDYVKDKDIGAMFRFMTDLVDEGSVVNSSVGALSVADKILERIKSLSEKVPQEKDHKIAHVQAKALQGKIETGEIDAPMDIEGFLNGRPIELNASGDVDSEKDDDAPEWSDGYEPNQEPIEAKHEQTIFRDWGRDSDPKRYLVYRDTTDEDEVHFTLSQRESYSPRYQRAKSEVHQYIGNMAAMLELALISQSEARWVGGARRGKQFDRRRLAAWAGGIDDDRLYRVKEQGDDIDTAVTLLWDCSGSMGSSSENGSKAYLAQIAAIAFHEALKRANVAHEVLGFDTGGGYSRHITRSGNEGAQYSRVAELNNHYVFVPFGESDGRALCHITGRAANRDGEAVLWAAKRLAQRVENRKILIVGSDGHPQGARYHRTEENYLREVVQQVIGVGIEMYALGIKDDSVKRFYPEWTVIDSAKDLPRAVMTQLVQSLTAHRGTNAIIRTASA